MGASSLFLDDLILKRNANVLQAYCARVTNALRPGSQDPCFLRE